MDFRVFPGKLALQNGALRQLRQDALEAKLRPSLRAYYRVRRLVPLPVRRMLQRSRTAAASGKWYIPDAYLAAFLSNLATVGSGVSVLHPWPNGCRFGFVLTHDVDTIHGFRNIQKIANIEEELGLRSAWYIVPYKYKIDDGIIRDLQSRSFEIGIHGYNHDGKLFSSQAEFNRRVPGINDALHRYRALGFRSPMVHRNLEWLQQLMIEYDASCFDIDPFQPMPGGVGTIWPFIAGKLVELPYTLPQDHTLFIVLKERDTRVWEEKRDFLIRNHGMALMLTHPDYLTTQGHLDLYRTFLAETQAIPGCWHALPHQVASWWRQREESTVSIDPMGKWSIHGPARIAGTVSTVEAQDGELSIRNISTRGDYQRS